MQKSGGAVISMDNKDIVYLFGARQVQPAPREIFDEEVCDFLGKLSEELRADVRAKQYTDILTFAFFIRRANLKLMKERYADAAYMIGKGTVFHIAPSNVPINFAYSWVFGLLSGNANIVRVLMKDFIQVRIICDAVDRLILDEQYRWVEQENAVVMYDHAKKELTDLFSAQCQVRLIWGGDHTIEMIRQSKLPPRSTEITFADRYSFALMDAKAVLDSSEQEMSRLAAYFYNDTYLMDQNACSTPHMICWIGEGEQYQKAQKRFWEHIYKEAERYTLEDIKASEKFTMLCSYLMELDTKQTDRYQNLLYVISLNKLPENITKLRGRYGLFFQKEFQNVQDALVHLNDTRVQTCVVYGVDEKEIKKEVIHMHMLGIDRVVPIGKSLDIDLNWDGYDMIRGLSRKIC